MPSDPLETHHIDSARLSSVDTAGDCGRVHRVHRLPRDSSLSGPSEKGEGRLPKGHLLQDRYRILTVVAVGGMSAVYKAQDLRFSKVVRACAIKEMIISASDASVRQMMLRNFVRETSILATLSHPGIVQVYDCFTEGERSYVVLEYVQGHDLETILEDTEEVLPEDTVVSWALQLCEVLSYLHSHVPRPIVFRDVKPSNVMLDEHGRVKLIDFGIAKVFHGGKKGTMIGTEGYSPPEQYQGVADPRVDIYALGATLHHLLSKRDPRLEPPFSFESRPIPQTNPNVSQGLLDVVGRALAYDPDDRFNSADEMGQALMSLRSAGSLSGPSRIGALGVRANQITPLWRFALEDEVRSSPAVSKGTVFVGAYDHNLYALSAETGEFVWKYATDGGIGSSPCVHRDMVFVGSSDCVLYAVSAADGRIRWTCPTEGQVWSSPHAAFEHVFFGSDDGHLYAVNTESGRVAWRFRAEGSVRSSPDVGEEAIYVGCEAGVVYAVDMGGTVRWHFRARRNVTSSPAVTDEMVYVGGHDKCLYALDVRSGWLAWRYRTDGPIMSSPTVQGGLVFVGSADGHLYALEAETGRLVWRYGTDGQVTSSPTVSAGVVYVGSVDGGIYSVDAEDGRLRWCFYTDGPVTSSPTAVGGVVYVGSCDLHLYALPA